MVITQCVRLGVGGLLTVSASSAFAQGLALFRSGVEITQSDTYESPGRKPSSTTNTWRLEAKGNVLTFGAFRPNDGARSECIINGAPSNMGLLFAPNKTMSGEFRCDRTRSGTQSHYADETRWIRYQTRMSIQGAIVSLSYQVQSITEKEATAGDRQAKETFSENTSYIYVLNLSGRECRVLRASGTGTYALNRWWVRGGSERHDETGTRRLNPLLDSSCKFVQ